MVPSTLRRTQNTPSGELLCSISFSVALYAFAASTTRQILVIHNQVHDGTGPRLFFLEQCNRWAQCRTNTRRQRTRLWCGPNSKLKRFSKLNPTPFPGLLMSVASMQCDTYYDTYLALLNARPLRHHLHCDITA